MTWINFTLGWGVAKLVTSIPLVPLSWVWMERERSGGDRLAWELGTTWTCAQNQGVE